MNSSYIENSIKAHLNLNEFGPHDVLEAQPSIYVNPY
jgi:hypothetical protein